MRLRYGFSHSGDFASLSTASRGAKKRVSPQLQQTEKLEAPPGFEPMRVVRHAERSCTSESLNSPHLSDRPGRHPMLETSNFRSNRAVECALPEDTLL